MSLTQFAEAQYNELSGRKGAEGLALRQRAWAEYLRQGLPDRRNEAWKYSSLAEIAKRNWLRADPVADLPAAAAAVVRAWRADFDVAVMVNGQWSRKHSHLTLESGYEFTTPPDHALEVQLEDGFVSLAVALNRGGYRLSVAPGIQFPRPLLIVHCASGGSTWSSTLNSVSLGAGSALQLAEIFVGDAPAYMRTDVTQVEMAADAKLSWARVQRESPLAVHFGDVQVRQGARSRLDLTQLNLGAVWARGSSSTALTSEGAEALVSGLTLAGGEQHIDQRVQVRHLAARTNSAQLFKGVLKDRARGILNGKIHIAAGAQKVVSSQLNHNLLLSPHAEADTKPELEIFADDVKANHGASVGRMDEDELFYLMSRAISRAEAVRILARAFVGDVLMKMPAAPLREFLEANVEDVLPEFARQMESQ